MTVMARRGAAGFAPDREFSPAEIDALGADDIGDVVGKLNAAVGGQTPPVVIINGQRVADPEALLVFPPDALARVEVLPPTATAIYGDGDPTRRVLNVVLLRRFDSYDAAEGVTSSTSGGYQALSGELKRSRIVEADTSQLRLQARGNSGLSASDRPDYLQDHPGSAALDLRPQVRRVAADLSLTRSLGDWRGAFRGGVQAQRSRFVVGADGRFIANRNSSAALNGKVSLSGNLLNWSVRSSLSGSLSRFSTEGATPVRSNERSMTLDTSVNRNVLTLPAGPVALDLSGQVYRSRSLSAGANARTSLHGRTGTVGADLSIPLTRAVTPGEGGGRFGPSFLKLGASHRAADAGSGDNLTLGAFWSPLKVVSLNGAWVHATEAPTDLQRFAPLTTGQAIVVHDFRTGRSVTVTPLLGGNASLRSATRDMTSLGVSAGPFTTWRVLAGASVRQARLAREIGALPMPTSDIEAAFPERFRRDDAGDLISIDQRPINITSSSTRLLTGNLSISAPADSALVGSGGALQLSLSYSLRLNDTTVIRDGLSRMDRLSGDAGGVARQEFFIGLDARRDRMTLNLAGHRQSGYRLRQISGQDGPGDLDIGAFSMIDLKLGYIVIMAGRGAESARRNQGLTVNLAVENLLDRRPEAHLTDGRVAPGYGRDDRDPVGRSVKLELLQRF
ncbi:TonB-dependent receptor [Caulobacter sp.]|uniref:TonB-dependent receptor n=1 Tax=Caulobacter sp. TaxID=78 RepID=UPI002B497F0C|nr:TonB-dependent receptor [Caulobacter sp.]HJV42103.1 TonB-dependent receptor [Caulobacter sp.]